MSADTRIPDYSSETQTTRRTLWEVEFETAMLVRLDGGWPSVLVEKWERNAIGERRFLDSRVYRWDGKIER